MYSAIMVSKSLPEGPSRSG